MRAGLRLAHRLSRCQPHDLGGLAFPAWVGVGDGEAEGFEFCQEGAQAALVVEPGLVVGELVVGEAGG
jgi:hypothetical protein